MYIYTEKKNLCRDKTEFKFKFKFKFKTEF